MAYHLEKIKGSSFYESSVHDPKENFGKWFGTFSTEPKGMVGVKREQTAIKREQMGIKRLECGIKVDFNEIV